jgi:hypothetical protein
MVIDSGETSPHEEPCVGCGEETAIGSIFFSDRREGRTPHGRPAFLCSECQKRVPADVHPVDMSDPEVYLAVVAAAQFVMRHGSI